MGEDNMDFEYNGNLLKDDRINLVAKEITSKYSKINFEKAKEAAMLEGRISDTKTINDELNRLYNIMLVNSDNKGIVLIVYKDFLEALKNSYNEGNENNYIYLIDDINSYLENKMEFPMLCDYQ